MANRNGLLGRVIPIVSYIKGLKDLTVVVFIMAILAIIIVPLPSIILDFLLTVSLAVGVLIILISIYIQRPTDLTTFPTLLLIITLFRLSLNIATTRMILTYGHEGPENVSDIIASFGNFVVGGNFVIGTIVFSILVLVNFMVITKGSTRVAEVAARFSLDAMPGKQMAIDADLNAGLIDDKEAKTRRAEISREADFYGAMDGSSKFVKGDAVAGIIITLINIIGGFLIGVFQHDLTMSESAETYTILTIGDGLVSQIPALIISTATGIIVTRASKEADGNFAEGAVNQLFNEYKTLFIVGAIMILFALVPGLPTFSLGFVGIIFIAMAYLMKLSKDGKLLFLAPTPAISTVDEFKKDIKAPKDRAKKSSEDILKEEEEALKDILKVEVLELALGYQLIKLADPNQNGDLLEKIRGTRRKIAGDYGFLLPQVRIRDNLHISPLMYQILLKGVEIGSSEIMPDKFLALNNGFVTDEIEGIATKEPAFGLDALWIESSVKEDAIIAGYTVVDPSTIISTHMAELIKKYAEELLTKQEVQSLIDKIKVDYPIVVEDVLRVANIGLIQKVLKALLHDRIPIKDMLTILETISDTAEYVKSVDVIVEQVRARLARVITNIFKSDDGTLKMMMLDLKTEQYLLDRVKEQQGSRKLLLSVGETSALVNSIKNDAQRVLQRGITPAIIILDPLLRKPVADTLYKFGMDEIVVLSHAEIDTTAKFEVLSNIAVNF